MHRSRPQAASARDSFIGPPPLLMATVVVVLFMTGLVASTIVAGEPIPSPFVSTTDLVSYFGDNTSAMRISGTFQFASAIPLAVLTAAIVSFMHHLGVRAAGLNIALLGGLGASVMLALSGFASWLLSRPEALAEPTAVHLIHDVGFLTGGVGYTCFFGLLLAGISITGMFHGHLPKPLATAGIVVAVLAELSFLTLVVSEAGVLLPISRFSGFVLLIAFCVILRGRPAMHRLAAQST